MEDISGLRGGQNHAPTATLATVSPTYSGRVTAGFRISVYDRRNTQKTIDLAVGALKMMLSLDPRRVEEIHHESISV
jgi:hypothetical protein